MLRLSRSRHAGDMLESMVPGYRNKIWAQLSDDMKRQYIKRSNDAFEAAIMRHKQWGGILGQYKSSEGSMKPNHKYRKPAIDWRRQHSRGTLHVGTFYEGPSKDSENGGVNPSNYTPTNTFNRMDNVYNPFSEKEWEIRKEYRSFDMVKVMYGSLGVFLAYRCYGEWPVVWC